MRMSKKTTKYVALAIASLMLIAPILSFIISITV